MPMISAAEFRELVKSGKVKAGKKGRLALNGGAGSTKIGKKVQEVVKTGDRSVQGIYKEFSKDAPQLFKIDLFMNELGIKFVKEYRFAPPRKFRADRYLPDFGIMIEYEGINSGKSRHTTIAGYTKDCQKYNLAQLKGLKVFRYTALNYTECLEMLEKLT